MKKIPLVPTDKLMGHLKSYVNNPLEFLDQNWKKHGDIFRFRLAHRTLIVIFHPDQIRHVLQENHSNYRKSLAYRKLKLLLGNGLFTSEGDHWLAQRRLAQPAFHREKINRYINDINFFASEMVKGWKSAIEKNQPVELKKEMTAVTLTIISRCLLGIEIGRQHEVIEQKLPFVLQFMIRRVTSTVNVPLFIPLPQHLKFKSSVRMLENLIDELIAERRSSRGISHGDLLTMLMEAKDEEGNGMSDQQLKDEIMTFFLAGHETSAVALCWIIYLLSRNKSVLEKLRREFDQIFSEEIPSSEKWKSCSYTQCVIKEAMRLYSPIWVLGREALQEDKIGEYKIRKGDSIIFSPYLIHRHPAFWENPEEFIPERFSTDRENSIYKFSYFPFGGGPRLCIGNNFAMIEMTILLAHVVRNFDFELEPKEQTSYDLSLTLRPAGPFHLQLKKRNQNCNEQYFG